MAYLSEEQQRQGHGRARHHGRHGVVQVKGSEFFLRPPELTAFYYELAINEACIRMTAPCS
jgi:hypothetical protein